MKNIITVLTLAFATLFLAQCKKQIIEQPSVTPSGETIEVSLNADNGSSKTIIDGTTIKWRVGDRLHVVGETNGYLGFITAQNEGVSAYFTGTITKPAASSQTLHFYYIGDENKVFSLVGDNYTYDISTQTGTLSDISDNFHLMHGQITGVASGTTNLGTITMTSMMSIAKLQFSKTGTLATKLACYGATTTATLNTKTGELTSGVADVITLKGVTTTKNEMTKDGETVSNDYYMVLLPGNQTLTFANEVLNDVWRSAPKTLTVEVNKFYTSNGNVSDPAATVALNNELAGALPGRFSIGTNSKGAKDYKYFSKGNLYWDGENFKLETNQYGCEISWNANHVSHFFWQPYSRMTNSYTSSYNSSGATTNDIFFTNSAATTPHSSFTVEGVSDKWRTLSKAEWDYVLGREFKVGYATVAEKHGLIIIPDSFTDPKTNNGSGAFVPKTTTGFTANLYTSGENWEAMEKAGAVFLPVTGVRNGTSLSYYNTDGSYWSSISNPDNVGGAGRMHFTNSSVTNDNYNRGYGSAVRLIR